MAQQQIKANPIILFFATLTTKKIIILLTIIGYVVFCNTFTNDFVWDDHSYIVNDPSIHSFSFSALFGPNPFNIPQYYYRPISAMYFALIYIFFGAESFFYHFFQISLHITNTIFLFLLFSRFLNKRLSFLLSAIFLVHPINSESVDFIAAAVGPLSLFFGLGALLIMTKKNLTKIDYLSAVGLLILSVFSKETGLLFLPLIILYRVLFLQKRDVKILSVLSFGIAALYPIVRFSLIGISKNAHTNLPIAKADLYTKTINIPAIFFYYLKIFFFPFHIFIDQLWIVNKISIIDFYIPLLIILIIFLSIVALGIYIFKKARPMFAPFLFFLAWLILGYILLLPLSSLDMTVADRWFYFPIVGLLGIIGIAIQQLYPLINEKNIYQKIAITVAILLVLVFSLRTFVRNTNWKNDITLNATQAAIQDNFDIELDLGEEYVQQGDFDQAIYHLQKSIAIYPADIAYYNLGYAFVQENELNKARNSYVQALHAAPFSYTGRHPEEMYGIVGVVLSTHDLKTAEYYVKNGLEIYPDSARLWSIYAVIAYNLHDKKGALLAANNSLKLAPSQQEESILHSIQNNQPLHLSTTYSPLE